MFMDEKKCRLLHVARRRVGMDEDAYRAMLHRIGGVASSKELDRDSFDAVMRQFATLGFESDFLQKNLGYRDEEHDMATPNQIAKIRDLWAQFTNGAGTDSSLNKWLEGRFKVAALRFLTRAKAMKATAALLNMVKRRKPKDEAA